MHYTRQGNEQVFLQQMGDKNVRSNFGDAIKSPDKIYQYEIVSMKNYGFESQTLKDLFSTVPKGMFSFYAPMDNDVDYDTAGYYCPTPNMIYIPGASFIKLEHEVAHFLEMSSLKRLTYTDMGMSDAQGSFNSKGYFAAFVRELRVRQIQRVLMDEPGANNPVNGFDDIIRNPCWHAPDSKRFLNKEQAQEWAIDIANKTRKTWTHEKIRHEFQTRIDYMQNWMSSSPSIH